MFASSLNGSVRVVICALAYAEVISLAGKIKLLHYFELAKLFKKSTKTGFSSVSIRLT